MHWDEHHDDADDEEGLMMRVFMMHSIGGRVQYTCMNLQESVLRESIDKKVMFLWTLSAFPQGLWTLFSKSTYQRLATIGEKKRVS